MNIRKTVIGACVLMLGGLALPSIAQEQNVPKLIKDWLVRYHDPETTYIEFPNGLIAKVGPGSKFLTAYIDTGAVVLWHCAIPTFFDRGPDANLYLAGKAVQWTESGGDQMPGRYGTQCQLHEFPGSLRTHLASQ